MQQGEVDGYEENKCQESIPCLQEVRNIQAKAHVYDNSHAYHLGLTWKENLF